MQATNAPMRKGDHVSTIGYPMWLLVIAAVLLVARIGGNFHQLLQPQVTTGLVDTPQAPDNGRLKLYAFLGEDGIASERLYDALNHNRELKDMVAKNFDVVQVIDSYQEDKKKEPLFDKYRIYELPTLVITLSDGTEVTQQAGFVSSQLSSVFLKGSMVDIDFVVGKKLMDDGRYIEAAAAFDRYPKEGVHRGYSSQSKMFEVACLVLSHQMDKAAEVSAKIIGDEGLTGYPTDQCNYMIGRLREKQLLMGGKYLTSENEFALAVKDLADGKREKALDHLRKIVRESYTGEPERDFALATLKREFNIDASEPKDH